MKYRDVLRILRDNGFSYKRDGKGDHKIWAGEHSGKTWVVTLSYNNEGNDVPKGTLGSIKRQSGLPKQLFPK